MIHSTKQLQHWQTPDLRKALAKVFFEKPLSAEEYKNCQRRSLAQINDAHYDLQIEGIALWVKSFENYYSNQPDDSNKILKDYLMLRSTLERQTGQLQRSRLSWLAKRIESVFIRYSANCSETEVSTLEMNLSAYPKSKVDFKEVCKQVSKLYENLQVDSALERIDALWSVVETQTESQMRDYLLARGYWLSGDSLGSLSIIEHYKNKKLEESNLLVQWQIHRCRASITGNLDEMMQWIRTEENRSEMSSLKTWAYILFEARLWSYSVSSMKWIQQQFKAKPLKQAEKLDSLLFTLSDCYKTKIRLEKKLESAAKLMSMSQQVQEPEIKILFWASLARFYLRHHQKDQYNECRKMVEKISMTLATEKHTDVLNVLPQSDVEIQLNKTIDRGLVSRGLSYTSLTKELGSILGWRRVSRALIEGKNPKLTHSEKINLAEAIANRFGMLHGPAMKMGQMISLYADDMNPQIREIFDSLHGSSHGVSLSEIFQAQKELGTNLEKSFKNIEAVPLGTGSIGQVHRAELLDGRTVAVKFQYPGIQKAIASDLRLLKLLKPIIQLLTPALNLSPYLKELESRLLEEVDYQKEAIKMKMFSKIFSDDPRIKIPRVYLNDSSPTYLTTEYISDGIKYKQFKQNATQKQKDIAGETIVNFVVSSCLKGHFNTDPHPGNFLFSDSSVTFLDFGSVKLWRPDELTPWQEIIASGIFHDREIFKKALKKMSILGADDFVNIENIYQTLVSGEKGLWTSPGVQRLDLKTMKNQMSTIGERFQPQQGATKMYPEYLFGFRVYFGHVALVADLGARSDWNQLVKGLILSHCPEVLN